MAIYLQWDAYICDRTTYENVTSLGKYGLWLCERDGVMTGNNPISPQAYDFFTSQLTSGSDVFGGSYLIRQTQQSASELLPAFVPGASSILIPETYVNNNYTLKLVNKDGMEAVLTSYMSSQYFGLLVSGVKRGTFSLIRNSLASNIIMLNILYCDEIKIPFDNTVSFFEVTIQSNWYWSSGRLTSSSYLLDFLNGTEIVSPTSDPYAPGGETTEGGGEGTFDNTTEPIPVPDLPITSASDTGFISLYRPDVTQLKALATYLWSAGFDLDTFKKIFADPISAILGLSLVPLSPTIGASASVVIGNINSGVTMPKITSQFIKYSCGSLTIEEYWGGYLDYSPYTRAEIYLPFIGAKPLNIDDIMGKTLSLWYIIDVLSGGCVACLEAGGSVLYQFIGQCACTIPVTGRDMSSIINGVIGAASSGLRGLAAGGIGLGALGAVSSVAGNVTSMKPHIEKSGSMGGMGGMLGVKTPYIILTRPRQALPANQNIFTGYPSYITTTLGECSGFTVVQDVHLAGFSATDDEKTEIERLLKEGVLL